MRRTNDFQSIPSEGGLLPPDLLRRVLDPREKLPGTLPEDYGLPKGELLNEVITQSWNRMRKHWVEFRPVADALPETEPGTGLTNEKWTLPLIRELDKFLTQILTRSQRHNEKGLAAIQLTLLFNFIFKMPRHRIELWTRGFSVRCSTD